MSTSRWWTRLLLALLMAAILSYGEGGTVLHSIDDKIKLNVSLGSPAGFGRFKRQGATYEPIRLYPFYDDSVDTKDPSVRTRIQEVIIPRILSFLSETVMVRPVTLPLLIDRNCNAGGAFSRETPNSALRCVTTCAAQTTCGGVVTIPDDHLRACIQCNNPENGVLPPRDDNCETIGNDGAGVDNTDFILYVSSMSIGSCSVGTRRNSPSTIAFAATCALEADFDRPIVGYVNFCPSAFSSSSQVDDEFLFTVTKHEILHALGFTSSLYPFWRDENGNPRTPRTSNGQPPFDDETGRFIASSDTVQVITHQDWLNTNGDTVTKIVTQLVTPNIVAEGRQHFNCPTLTGVELEDFGGDGTAGSHWEKRILGNEAMTGILTDSPVFSRFTLALLEDSGWYRVNYDNAGTLLWGKDAGCIFATRSCQEYIMAQMSNSESISPFCSPTGSIGCTIARESIGQCGPLEVSDNCPVFQQLSGGDCTNPANFVPDETNIYGQTYSNCSRCFEHGEATWMTSSLSSPGGRAGCYQYLCLDNEVTVYVGGDGGVSYSCNRSGQVISVDADVSGIGEVTGSIICPPYEEICFDFDSQENCPEFGERADPPNSASGHIQSLSVIINFLLLITLLAFL